MRAEPLVEIKNISLNYHSDEGEIAALKNLSLEIFPGEFVSIVGPSGCGKSTLLNIVAGLILPTNGKVFLKNKEVKGPSSLVGYMPQSDQLFEWRTIWKNVLLGLEVQHKINSQTEAFAQKLLKNYGLLNFKDSFPRQLSGGMRQRVALIRTLAVNPEILLLDEAFSALDYQTRLVVSDEVKQIIKKEKKTTILVTHDIAEAISMADKVIVLTQRPAGIKSKHSITLSCEENTPLKCRKAPEFSYYFNTIWKELEMHVR
ncbi:ABC transporter ATP-binding protein [Candidatus Contubernalis alkaliaceticus]|uniref:ABC transporter ATP-binding protein n=1 Tax=Candidatus Contubernalis alkaliaceticus TaxID=338645 RepID=UPI001F4C3E4D|nr:ABC transporter ATP-binding protein [Candidatus Contubernalis alkalaceticus]UNC92698.1 ABC transporter ATP-binding protein [Candidatus Contubernalis alkalaceticus]